MQTIRIFRHPHNGGGLVHIESGIPGHVETDELRRRFPEGNFLWLR